MRILIIRPHFALAHHRIDCIFHTLRWILMPLEQSFDHDTHGSPGAFFLLPIDGTILSQLLSQFPGESDKLVVAVEIFDGLWLGQRVIEGHFLFCQPKRLALLVKRCNLRRRYAALPCRLRKGYHK